MRKKRWRLAFKSRTRSAIAGRLASRPHWRLLTWRWMGTTLPTPLYVIYQSRWHFSSAVITLIFAV